MSVSSDVISIGSMVKYRGAYNANTAYYTTNVVTMYSCVFEAISNAFVNIPPVKMNDDGTIALANTQAWRCLVDNVALYNAALSTNNLDSRMSAIENKKVGNGVQAKTEDIESEAITGPKLASNAVTTGKIAPNTIKEGDINPSAFDDNLETSRKLADAKIIGDKLKEQKQEFEQTMSQYRELPSKVSELEGKITEVDEQINGQITSVEIIEKTRYIASGKTTGDARFASTNILPVGTYQVNALENGLQYAIFYYISDSQCIEWYNFSISSRTIVTNQPIVVTFRKMVNGSLVQLTSEDVEYLESHKPTTSTRFFGLKDNVQKNTDDIAVIQNELHPHFESVTFCDFVDNTFLTEMYFPNITSEWKLTGFTIKEDYLRLNLKKPDGNVVLFGHGTLGDGCGIGEKLSGKVIEWVDGNSVVGYFVCHLSGDGYSMSNTTGRALNVDKITDINNSPRIKEYLSRNENLVLLGDSLFGYKPQNILKFYLKDKTGKKVFNVGFPGCRASLRSNSTGNENWNALSLVGVVDSIVSNDFSKMENAIDNLSRGYSYFKERVADLKLVDFSQPTTIFINYGNNDMTGGNLIGNMWESGKDDSYWDKTTMLGAINYSLSKLITLYPHIKVVYLTPNWRMIGSTVDPDGGTSGDNVAPYEYTNTNGESFMQFVEAIIANTTRLGVKCLDTFRMGGRTALNFDYYSVDSSHFNAKGYEIFANVIADTDKCL